MTDPNLVSGERVVDLAASLRFAALVSGGISCAAALWILRQSVLWSLSALFVGGMAGFLIGVVAGRLVFPSSPGQVVVVKVGSGSLGATLRAGLLGAIAAGVITAAGPAAVLGQASKLLLLVGLGCGLGIAVGGTFGYLASR